MSLPAREPPPSADASLTLRFDDSDRDVLAQAFRTPGDGPSAWRLNRAAHRISLVEGMEPKFSLPVAVLRSVRDWDRRPFLIASMDTAKREPHRGAAQARPWDLIVVDEAHRLKNRLSLNWRFVAGLSKKYMLLLTATPVQNDME